MTSPEGDTALTLALTRCGLAPQDLVVKPFEAFKKEFPQLPQNVVAQKFSSYQEVIMRNIDRVQTEIHRSERQQLTPRRAESNAVQLVRASPRREAREREKARVIEARARRAELRRQEEAALEQQLSERARRDADHEMERLIVDAVNAERNHARYLRDNEMTHLRRELVATQQPTLPLIPSAPSTPKAKGGPKPASLIDKRIGDASASRHRQEAEAAERVSAKRQIEERQAQHFVTGTEVEEEIRRCKLEARRKHAVAVKKRAAQNHEEQMQERENKLRAAEEQLAESLMRSTTERASNSARFAAARDKCLQNASEYRTEQAYALWQRHIVKTASEEERKAELLRAAACARSVRTEERDRRFEMKEASVARMKKEHAAKSEEIAKAIEERQVAATIRRDFLINAVYE